MNINVKKGSSVWQLDTCWGSDFLSNNFCSLFWSCLWRLFFIFVGCLLTGAYLGILFAVIAASFSVGFIIWSLPLISTVSIFVCICIIFSIFLICEKAKESTIENPKGVLSNTINAYKSWKDKYCPKVEEV